MYICGKCFFATYMKIIFPISMQKTVRAQIGPVKKRNSQLNWFNRIIVLIKKWSVRVICLRFKLIFLLSTQTLCFLSWFMSLFLKFMLFSKSRKAKTQNWKNIDFSRQALDFALEFSFLLLGYSFFFTVLSYIIKRRSTTDFEEFSPEKDKIQDFLFANKTVSLHK